MQAALTSVITFADTILCAASSICLPIVMFQNVGDTMSVVVLFFARCSHNATSVETCFCVEQAGACLRADVKAHAGRRALTHATGTDFQFSVEQSP